MGRRDRSIDGPNGGRVALVAAGCLLASAILWVAALRLFFGG